MAERKATNKYYPPDWDPSKGSANTYQKTNHLRKRAKRIDDGILVVRFEMPFNIICLKCDNFIAMGVRYNADKTRTGNYYTTPIYKFSMKCHLCDNYFEIETDPSKFDYKIISGAKRQVRYDHTSASAENNDDCEQGSSSGGIEFDNKIKADAMSRLEKKVEDKLNEESVGITLKQLKDWRASREEDYKDNQLIRAQYRERRKNKRLDRERRLKLARIEKLKLKQTESMKPEYRKKQYMKLSTFSTISKSKPSQRINIKQEIDQHSQPVDDQRDGHVYKIKSEPS